jgi:hypothetical protein
MEIHPWSENVTVPPEKAEDTIRLAFMGHFFALVHQKMTV